MESSMFLFLTSEVWILTWNPTGVVWFSTWKPINIIFETETRLKPMLQQQLSAQLPIRICPPFVLKTLKWTWRVIDRYLENHNIKQQQYWSVNKLPSNYNRLLVGHRSLRDAGASHSSSNILSSYVNRSTINLCNLRAKGSAHSGSYFVTFESGI